jgi:hypothetical protein
MSDEYQKAEIVAFDLAAPGCDHSASIVVKDSQAERVVIVEKDIVDYVMTEVDGIVCMVPVLKADGTLGHPMYERQPFRAAPDRAKLKLGSGDE